MTVSARQLPELAEEAAGGLAEEGEEEERAEGDQREILEEAGGAVLVLDLAEEGRVPEEQVEARAEAYGHDDDRDREEAGDPTAVELREEAEGGRVGRGSRQEKGERRSGGEAAGEEDRDDRRRPRGADVGGDADDREEGDLERPGQLGEGARGDPGLDQGGEEDAKEDPRADVVDHRHQAGPHPVAEATAEGL